MPAEGSQSRPDPIANLSHLPPDSYTLHRLQHATPEHLHLTTRCCFIGPIPEGWLKSHRKQWYKHHLHINYYSRAATFSAERPVSRLRQLSGLDGPSSSAIYAQSFPQPDDVEEDDDPDVAETDEEATTEVPPAVPVPRSTEVDGSITGNGGASTGGGQGTGDGARSEAEGEPSTRSGSNPSFGTATDPLGRDETADGPSKLSAGGKARDKRISHADSTKDSSDLSGHSGNQERESDSDGSANIEPSDSKSSLLPRSRQPNVLSAPRSREPKNDENSNENAGTLESAKPARKDLIDTQVPLAEPLPPQINGQAPTALVRFNIPDDDAAHDRHTKDRLAKLSRRRSLKQFRRGTKHDGEIVKVEKMLVKVEATHQELSSEYDENESLVVESKTVEKWQEFVVVCRVSASKEAYYVLQLYKTRVIPEIQKANFEKHSTHEIFLSRKYARINLYSSLDKTVVVWVPWKQQTMIYLLRPRSLANSVEWYTFLRNTLGWRRPQELEISVPDLDLKLHLDNPFEKLEAQRDEIQTSGDVDDNIILRTMQEEQAVAGNIVKRCLEMLEDIPEWADLFKKWSTTEKMGLAWKRYDRLEWVHGANEQKMYGTIAMQRSHDLELRPKHHYPTSTKIPGRKNTGAGRRAASQTQAEDGSGRQQQEPSIAPSLVPRSMTEPSSVEGFLIRLTSQRGRGTRMGRMFYKRLYFSTHDQFLCFSRPAHAIPPPPPRMPMTERSTIPSTRQIAENMPLIYAIVPFRLENGEIAWLKSEDASAIKTHDQDAFDEAQRRVNALLRADGYIDMCKIKKVRHVVRGSTPADRAIDEGDAVDFNEDVPDTQQDDGAVSEFDDDRTFELVLDNGLVVRLEAYSAATKREWIRRLDALVRYWKLRKAADLELLKSVRQTNLQKLNIDEDGESYLGQFAEKWEVAQAVASAELFHMCGISCCRAVTMAGFLYWKPKRHATFNKASVILCHGQLLLFQGSLRSRVGVEVPYSHHERLSAIDLRNCYVYSGLITEGDLLYREESFDRTHPGRHALPRLYLDDGWTSSDDDTMTCFVIWQAARTRYFRSSEEQADGSRRQRLRQVTSLGVPGRSIVFRARSRTERDHWVMNIALEIERAQQVDEIRVVPRAE